jgi:antitoxin component YwqK of YwqJK toxin-antitoxin module
MAQGRDGKKRITYEDGEEVDDREQERRLAMARAVEEQKRFIAEFTGLEYELILNVVEWGKEPNDYTGWVKELHSNGATWILAQIKEGKRGGLTFLFHENGQRKAKGNFEGGKQDGLWIYYNEDGTKSNRITYKDGKRVN